MKKQWWVILQVVLVVAALAGSLYVALTPANSLLRWYNIDDAFYYYKVARNILAGNGVTFDGINLSNGFHPLWMVVCLAVFWTSNINLVLPLRLLVIVSGLFNAATALLLFRLLRKYLHPMAAFVAALFWAIFPQIYNTGTVHGMESAISIFFIVLLIKTVSDLQDNRETAPLTFKSMALAGLVGAFTILSRLDNLFVVALLGLFLLFNIRHITRLFFYDEVALALSVFVVWFFRLGDIEYYKNLPAVYFMLVVALLVKPIVFYFCGLYGGVNRLSKFPRIVRQVIALAVNAALMTGILFVAYKLQVVEMISRSIILYDALLSFLLILCLRLFNWNGQSENQENPFKRFSQWVKAEWRSVLTMGLGYATPIAVLIGAYMAYNKWIFGTFTPVSGQVKTWWATLANTVYGHKLNMITSLGLSSGSNIGPWSLLTSQIQNLTDTILGERANTSSRLDTLVFLALFVALAIIVLAILSAHQNRLIKIANRLFLIPLVLGGLVHFAYYILVGYAHTRNWYWLAETLALVMILSLLLDAIFTWLDGITQRKILSVVVSVLLAVWLGISQAQFLLTLCPVSVSVEHENDYLKEVRQVESLTESGARIGMTGGGLVGYFITDRTVVNMDGLINSRAYFEAMQHGTARDFLDAIPLNYVFGQEYVVTESDPYKDILTDRLERIGFIRGFEGFTLYKYVIH